MTDFRLFCIGGFVGCGLHAACVNHGLIDNHDMTGADAMLVFGFMFACMAVAFFGKRP